ncbi:hypothetical protein [Bradyrhizobium diazoefficiens]|nr:hypothetical protein [Bradyrhizobium japonicum]
MKYPAAEFTSWVPQAQSSLAGMVKDSFSALAIDVGGDVLSGRSIVFV